MKYQLYNSLFLTLPFEGMSKTGTELPLFTQFASEGMLRGKDPKQIVEQYFAKRDNKDEGLVEVLNRFLQFVERQVVLFDALEEAAFEEVNDPSGAGTLPHLATRVNVNGLRPDLSELLQDYGVRLVLTAHPTQFYPGAVLGIISNLAKAIKANDLSGINDLLLQLGKTKFSNKEKPTPLEEAKSLSWYLINVFYDTTADIKFRLAKALDNPFDIMGKKPLFEVGFWPGGDRDGNPYVTHKTTLDVARLLKKSILDCYHNDLRKIKQRLTFDGILEQLEMIQEKLFVSFKASLSDDIAPKGYRTHSEFLDDLKTIRKELISKHDGLFLDHLDQLIYKVLSFGFHFATLDMRQDSRVHADALLHFCSEEGLFNFNPELKAQLAKWGELDDNEKHLLLTNLIGLDETPVLDLEGTDDNLSKEVVKSIATIRTVQERNGERGLNRYIISNTQRSADVLTILLFNNWVRKDASEAIDIDIVPLFETIEDLDNAMVIMEQLYKTPAYLDHLRRRGNEQSIMLGFSDGTKDGGPIAANWSIHKAKISLTKISKDNGITVHFFDGRGGPPARGGGNTHQYYRAQGDNIQQNQVQLTIQGQTISTKFGSLPLARYNVEELFTASLEQRLFTADRASRESQARSKKEHELMDELSNISLEAYRSFKEHPLFVPYLEEITPLKYISRLNIASRPSRRQAKGRLKFEDLRAIPFVSSWAQMKQNIPGYYGIGAALEKLIGDGRMEDVTWLYNNSLFFKTLVENGMQSLAKSQMQLTSHLADNETYGEFWNLILSEVNRCRSILKSITGQKKLMDNVPHIRASIDLREEVVLPLLVIQQFALTILRDHANDLDEDSIHKFEKIVLKALATNINASRNSA